MKLIRRFRHCNVVLAKSPFVSCRTGDLLRTTCGKHCVCFVDYKHWNFIADKSRNLFVNILIVWTLMVFTKWVARRVTPEGLEI